MPGNIQRVLISGGTGLIGGRLAGALLAKGIEVWILSRRPFASSAPSGAQVVAWDGRTTDGWVNLIDQVDAVIHLAGASLGSSPWTKARQRQIVESRVESGKALAGAIQAASARPKVFVQASAIGYYGNSEEAVFTEDSPAGDGWLSSVCIAWENVTRGVEDAGVRRVVTRSGLVLDKNGGILVQMALPVRLRIGGRIGSGRQWVTWIHIADEVRAILYLMENDSSSGAYNLTAPSPVTNAEFVHELAECLHRPDWLPTPALAIRLALGKMSELVLEGQKVLPSRLETEGFAFQFPDLRAALEDIYR